MFNVSLAARCDAVDVVLIYLSFNLIKIQIVYLADLGAGTYGLSELDIQKAEFSIDRGFH